MKRYFIHLAYDGTHYHGWQIQENAHTVQAELNNKLSAMLSTEINVVGCGRTDTGVHARSFYAHFEIDQLPFSEKDFAFKLNRFLPEDISVFKLAQVAEDLHSRFSAKSRTYRYYISKEKDPFSRKFSYFYPKPLNVELMQQAAGRLKNYEDFTSFSKLHTQTATNDCLIEDARWNTQEKMLVFEITADRFLRNMVRAIVGTLLEVGKGKMNVEDFCKIIEAKDRSKAGFSVPAQGLFLEQVLYPERL